MKVRIDLNSIGSVEKALAELDKYQERISQFATELVEELASEGEDIASFNFYWAEYAGENDAHAGHTQVKFTKDTRKATVYVDGNATLFIEFGTGIYKASAPDELRELESGSIYPHGTYGKGLGKNPKGWFYNGSSTPSGSVLPDGTEPSSKPGVMHTYGNDANSSFYRSRLELEQKYTDIAQRVYERIFK